MVKYAASILVLLFVTLACGVEKVDNAPHIMTKEQLLPLLAKSDVIIIDVRANYDWDKSTVKIKGAAREEGMKFGSWMNKYPKDKTIVLYCA
jgi:rhodanese-related sulfurtransferase